MPAQFRQAVQFRTKVWLKLANREGTDAVGTLDGAPIAARLVTLHPAVQFPDGEPAVFDLATKPAIVRDRPVDGEVLLRVKRLTRQLVARNRDNDLEGNTTFGLGIAFAAPLAVEVHGRRRQCYAEAEYSSYRQAEEGT